MEYELLQWLTEQLRRYPQRAEVRLGIGDDAALLQFENDECVTTTDMVMDGVDFIVGQHELARIGRKALAVNLSDLAAMAAVPIAALVSLALPRSGALRIAQQLFEGMLPLAAEFNVQIAGGDTNCWNGPLAISITAFGRVPAGQALLRSGAKPGDHIIVTGTFGGSLAGKHFDFTPRVYEALELRKRYELHAGCDVSDGLAIDLHRITRASGCGAVVLANAIPLSETIRAQCGDDDEISRCHALSDGEDFELILAVAAKDASILLREQPLAVPLTSIGVFTAEAGVWLEAADGNRRPLEPLGYIHGEATGL